MKHPPNNKKNGKDNLQLGLWFIVQSHVFGGMVVEIKLLTPSKSCSEISVPQGRGHAPRIFLLGELVTTSSGGRFTKVLSTHNMITTGAFAKPQFETIPFFVSSQWLSN